MIKSLPFRNVKTGAVTDQDEYEPSGAPKVSKIDLFTERRNVCLALSLAMFCATPPLYFWESFTSVPTFPFSFFSVAAFICLVFLSAVCAPFFVCFVFTLIERRQLFIPLVVNIAFLATVGLSFIWASDVLRLYIPLSLAATLATIGFIYKVKLDSHIASLSNF